MKQSGFTLVELIVGVSVMVGVMSAAYFCMSAGYRTREAIEQHSDLLQRGRTAIELIARDIRHASPTSSDLRFTGLNREKDKTQADNLDFVTHNWSPSHPEQADLCEVSYFVDADPKVPDQLNLYRRRDPTPDLEPFAGGTRELIARDIAGFRLEYYDGFEWLDEWRDDDEERAETLRPNDDELEEPEIDENGNEVPAADPYIPGQSGLPEAVRVTIAFRDRKARAVTVTQAAVPQGAVSAAASSAERGFDSGGSGAATPTAGSDPKGVVVVQSVVRITLTHRKAALEGGAFGPMEPEGFPSDGNSGFDPIDVDGESGFNR